MGEGAKDLGAYAAQQAETERRMEAPRGQVALTARQLARGNSIASDTEPVGLVARHADGYRAVHVQVDLGNGMSAEVQLVPSEIAKVQSEAHRIYDQIKRLDVTNATPEQKTMIKSAKDKINAIFDRAWRMQEWSKAEKCDSIA